MTEPDFVVGATHLLERAEMRNIVLRIMGACAVMHHVGKEHPLLDVFKSNRALTCIDFVTYRRFWPQVETSLQSEGYEPHVRFSTTHGDKQGEAGS